MHHSKLGFLLEGTWRCTADVTSRCYLHRGRPKNFGFGRFRHYHPTFSALKCLQFRKPSECGN